MPTVRFHREGITAECEAGADLRTVAQEASVQLYRSFHVWLNCKGKGKCGSCRIEVADAATVGPAARTPAECRHLDRRFSDAGTRLACQVQVLADTVVRTQPLKGRKRVETRGFIPRSF